MAPDKSMELSEKLLSFMRSTPACGMLWWNGGASETCLAQVAAARAAAEARVAELEVLPRQERGSDSGQ